MRLSVILPSYNPALVNIQQVLAALQAQTLDRSVWELIIIDNNSTNQVLTQVDLSWHPNACIIKETKQGLTYSRICGFRQAKGEFIVMVDDDNVLSASYLQIVVKYFAENPVAGTVGGRIEGQFIGNAPAEWTRQFWGMLAVKDAGSSPLLSVPGMCGSYPPFAPVGAGMAIRKSLLTAYTEGVLNNTSVITDRTANQLSSGGDNEINIQVLQQGYSVAYTPNLHLKHIIPAERLTKNYLARLNHASSKSWVQLLLKYKISPWEVIPVWTVPLRKIKAYFTYKAWQTAAAYIQWQGACGRFEGLSEFKITNN